MTDFEFSVKREMTWDAVNYCHTDIPTGNWTVSLPHQCDSWMIAGCNYADGIPHRQAVQELAAFITQAQNAMAALMAEEELNPDGD